ncbi:MAG: FAD-dependent oxidoreductase [Pseudomonadota bacterium]
MTKRANSDRPASDQPLAGRKILVAGAGVIGLWQAVCLRRAGADVTLCDAAETPDLSQASRYAGAMLSPWCEAETAPDVVCAAGVEGLKLWRDVYPDLTRAGSLVLATPRDQPDLRQFAKRTTNHEVCDSARIRELEPDLDERFPQALYFPEEAHMSAPAALAFLRQSLMSTGCQLKLGQTLEECGRHGFDYVIDARGLAAQPALPDLRGVRGERLIVRCPDVSLNRPVRLLHPRHQFYMVPWSDHHFMVGATVIENEQTGPATVRSVLELLGLAYAVHPAFADAEIIDVGAGVRPSFADNVPRARIEGKNPDAGGTTIFVNGAYRHGFLIAPSLAQAVTNWCVDPTTNHPLLEKRVRPSASQPQAPVGLANG